MNKSDLLISLGVKPEKINATPQPTAIWNMKLRTFVRSGHVDIEKQSDGNFIATQDNNRMVFVRSYISIPQELVDKINNNPDGIVFYDDGGDCFRFDFIPQPFSFNL